MRTIRQGEERNVESHSGATRSIVVTVCAEDLSEEGLSSRCAVGGKKIQRRRAELFDTRTQIIVGAWLQRSNAVRRPPAAREAIHLSQTTDQVLKTPLNMPMLLLSPPSTAAWKFARKR
jgi:hypothetical protein